MKYLIASLLLAVPASLSAQTPAPAKAKVLWDAWYTVTTNKKLRYGYYNDRTEIRDGRVHFQTHYWKKEEGFINEEQVGAFAEDNAALTPLFFNFHSTYRSSETQIDGTVEKSQRSPTAPVGHMLTVRIRRNTAGKSGESPVVRHSIPRTAFWSSLFPLWIGRHLDTLKAGKPLTFMNILEDGSNPDFNTVHGSLRAEPADLFSSASRTSKLSVKFNGVPSTWYVDPSGMPVRIEMPKMKTVVERVPEAQARKFLD